MRYQKPCLTVILMLCCVIMSRSQGTEANASEEVVIGHSLRLQSKVLNEERKILVHLPQSYEKTVERYPVLYVLDGEDYFLFSAAVSEFLSGSARIPEMIVIGIVNTNRGRDLWVNPDRSGAGDNFLKFLQDELIPDIESRYRTQPYRIIFGHSAGSIISVYTLLAKPDLFGGYIAASLIATPYLNLLNLTEFARQVLATSPTVKKSLFITLGDEPVFADACVRFLDLLKQSAPAGLDWKFLPMEGETHDSTPLQSLYAGLEYFYRDWTVPSEIATQGGRAVKEHYEKLSERFGYSLGLPQGTVMRFLQRLLMEEKRYRQGIILYQQLRQQYAYQGEFSFSTINWCGQQAIAEGKMDDAIFLFQFNAQEHPDSAKAYGSLGEAYEKSGQLVMAKKNYEIAAQKAKSADDQSLSQFKANLERINRLLQKKKIKKKIIAIPEKEKK